MTPEALFIDPGLYGQGIPHGFLARLRRESPVSWQPASRNPEDGFWLVVRHADVLQVSSKPELFSSAEGNILRSSPPPEMHDGMYGMLANHLATLDPPRHTVCQRAIRPSFAKRTIARLESHIRAEVVDVLEGAITRGECDIARDVALELPVRIILGTILGVDVEESRKIVQWNDMLVQDTGSFASPADALTAAENLYELALAQLRARRAEPRDDIAGQLASIVTPDGLPLTDEAFVGYWFPLVLGAFDTTAGTIAGAVLALIENPDQWSLLRADPNIVPTAVEEMFRWVSPVNYMRRTATRDIQLHGRNIRRGQRVLMSYPSANYDEHVFADPYRLDLTRSPNPHLTFGHGPHFCLGSHIARLLITTTLEELRRRVGEIEQNRPVERLNSNWIPRISALPVSLHRPDTTAGRTRRAMAISHGAALRTDGAPATLWGVLLRAARTHPSHEVTYIRKDGTKTATRYSDLVLRAKAVGHGIRAAGIRPGARVLLWLSDSQELLENYWGCIFCAVVPALLGGPEPLARADYQRFGFAAIITDADRVAALEDDLVDDSGSPVRIVAGVIPAAAPGADDETPPIPDAPAVLLFSSGSTGARKAIALSHRNILGMSLGIAQMCTMSSADVFVNWMPMDHIGGIGYAHTTAVVVGANQVLLDKNFVVRDPLRWFDAIHEFRGTVTWAPNVAYGLVNEHENDIRHRDWDLTSLRLLGNAGEAIVARTARRALSLLMSKGLPADAMHPMWGMSETASAAISSDRFSLDSTQDADPHVEVGKPIPGLSLRIADARGTIVPEGVVGHLHVRGQSVFSGYVAAGADQPFEFTVDGWFDTGDLAIMRSGRITLTGRSKDVVMINGIRVTAEEIELAVTHANVVPDSAVVVACAGRMADLDSEVPVIFVGLAEIQRRTLNLMMIGEQIRGIVVRRFGVPPVAVLSIPLEVIPRTSIGKVQRSRLGARFAHGEFDDDWLARPSHRSADKTSHGTEAVESRISAICQEIMGMPEISTEVELIDLGVTSLLMVMLRQALEREFTRVPTVAELYRLGTIASIAAEVA